MPVSKKAIEQRQEGRARAAQMKAPRRMDSDISNQHEYNDQDTIESQNSQSNSEADPDKMEDINISKTVIRSLVRYRTWAGY